MTRTPSVSASNAVADIAVDGVVAAVAADGVVVVVVVADACSTECAWCSRFGHLQIEKYNNKKRKFFFTQVF